MRKFAAILLVGCVTASVLRSQELEAPLSPPPLEAPKPTPDVVPDLIKRLTELEKSEAKRKEAQAKKEVEDRKKPTLKWMGQIQIDRYWVSQNDESRLAFGNAEGGAAFRRARIGMFGDYGLLEYRIAMDFALQARPSFIDVFIAMNEVPIIGRARVGHFFEPFSLEQFTQNRYTTFLERALPTQPFAPARNLGIMANRTFAKDRGTLAIGLFRAESDELGDDVGDHFQSAVTGRATWLPIYREIGDRREYVHLGFASSFRVANEGVVRFRAEPEARIGSATPNIPFVVNTGFIPARSFELVGFEGAWIHGPFSIQGEYMLVPVNALAGALFFHGWYVQASAFLTGESRPYRKSTAQFERIIPRRDFRRKNEDGCIERGPGAWEIAFRASQVDLDSGPVHGGKLTDFTVGLNWYLSPYLRSNANYVWAVNGGSRPGPFTGLFGMRIGYEF